ncbi:MAG: hypothetical protein WA484_00610 [Solirubrobacteraceae bacterium]
MSGKRSNVHVPALGGTETEHTQYARPERPKCANEQHFVRGSG